MYHEPTDRIKTFPLPDSHLHGAAVLACNVIDIQELLGELREIVLQQRQLTEEHRRLIFELSDLLTRQDTALQLAAAAREHLTFKVPGWFFQPESDNLNSMIARRARYLRSAKLDVDGAWDLLREFVESCHLAISDDDLAAIMKAAYQKRGR